jgi:hypothetical protein
LSRAAPKIVEGGRSKYQGGWSVKEFSRFVEKKDWEGKGERFGLASLGAKCQCKLQLGIEVVVYFFPIHQHQFEYRIIRSCIWAMTNSGC